MPICGHNFDFCFYLTKFKLLTIKYEIPENHPKKTNLFYIGCQQFSILVLQQNKVISKHRPPKIKLLQPI